MSPDQIIQLSVRSSTGVSSVYHSGFFAMGTRLNIVLPGVEEEIGERITRAVQAEVERIESLLSRFREESEISVINRQACREEYRISEEVFDLLASCVQYGRITNGAFDITMGPLGEYWKKANGGSDKIDGWKALLKNLGFDKIRLNPQRKSVRLDNTDVKIDLGGIGKGYALEKVRSLLVSADMRNAFVSFGESSVLALGHHPNGNCWRVGLNDHRTPGISFHTFDVANGSVSTSCNVRLRDDGTTNQHPHLIDPRSGHPVAESIMVGVLSDSPLRAEALSTACMVLNEQEIGNIRSAFSDIHVVKIEGFGKTPVVHTW